MFLEREENNEELEGGEPPPARPLAMLGVSIAAIALALLPAAVGVSILVGSTVPLEFAAAACLTLVATIKIGAAVGGLVAAAGGHVSALNRISHSPDSWRSLRRGGEIE